MTGAFIQITLFNQAHRRLLKADALALACKQVAVADSGIGAYVHISAGVGVQAALVGDKGMRRDGFTSRAGLRISQAARGLDFGGQLLLGLFGQGKAALDGDDAHHGLELLGLAGQQAGLVGFSAFAQWLVVAAQQHGAGRRFIGWRNGGGLNGAWLGGWRY